MMAGGCAAPDRLLNPFIPERVRRIRLEERAKTRTRTPYYDMTFSAEKSVSFGFAGLMAAARAAREAGRAEEAERLEARARSVEAAVMAGADTVIDHVERRGAIIRTGHHSAHSGEFRDAAGFVAAKFLQHTSRSGDPQLHVQIPILNRAQRADGLLIGRLVHDQHRVLVIEVTDRPGRRGVQDLLLVPDRPRQQVLQPVWPAMPDRLGDRLAVVIFQFHQQPADHLPAALPGLPPGKAPGHLPQQIRQQRGPGIIGYRGSSDCRILIVSHKPIMIAAAAPLHGHPSDLQPQPRGHELQLP
jgi:hypothetical protein